MDKRMGNRIFDPMLPQIFHIEGIKQETDDTFTLDIKANGAGENFSFKAGQFNMLYVFGVGEVPISISGDPTKKGDIKHTTRVVGAVTKSMRKLKRGDAIGLRGPFGSHWPLEEVEGKDVVIVAGGIGLAPLRPALYQLLKNRSKYGKVVLLYGTRTPADILFEKDLKNWRSQFDLDIYITVDRAMEDWRGNVGVVTTLIARAPFDHLNAVAMVCGPEVMMRFTIQALKERGLKSENIFISMERNMKCAIGFCGHCQYGPEFICKDGPVFSYEAIESMLVKTEV